MVVVDPLCRGVSGLRYRPRARVRHLVEGSLCSGGLTEAATNSCSSFRNCISYYRSWGSSCRFSCSSEALRQKQRCKSLPPKSKTEFWCNFSSGQSRARLEMTPMEKSLSRRTLHLMRTRSVIQADRLPLQAPNGSWSRPPNELWATCS
jgi:hypothetical protein